MERPPSTHMVGYSAFLSLSMLHQWSLVCPESLSALVWRDPCDDQVLMTLAGKVSGYIVESRPSKSIPQPHNLSRNNSSLLTARRVPVPYSYMRRS